MYTEGGEGGRQIPREPITGILHNRPRSNCTSDEVHFKTRRPNGFGSVVFLHSLGTIYSRHLQGITDYVPGPHSLPPKISVG